MKINKKISALVLAGVLACTTPAMVYAQDSSDVVDQAVEILQDNGVDELLSDPDKVVDLIVQAKEILGQVDVTMMRSVQLLMWQQRVRELHFPILRNRL